MLRILESMPQPRQALEQAAYRNQQGNGNDNIFSQVCPSRKM